MANFHGVARSNYVYWHKDKLNALSTLFDITVVHDDLDRAAILSNDENGTPSVFAEDLDFVQEQALAALFLDPDDFEDQIEFLDVVHLAFAKNPRHTFVWMEIGNEKMRYLHGMAIAIDETGEILDFINLRDIYTTPDMTRAEY